jgi:hypothetical protein
MMSEPAGTSCAELYVADGFSLANKNLACMQQNNVLCVNLHRSTCSYLHIGAVHCYMNLKKRYKIYSDKNNCHQQNRGEINGL